MVALDEDAMEEPQQDDDREYGGRVEDQEQDDLGLDLLARARLLCQAANEIALPMLRSVQQLQAKKPSPPKARKPSKTSRPSTREEVDQSASQSQCKSRAELPKPSSGAKSREQQPPTQPAKKSDALPPIQAAPPVEVPERKAKVSLKPAVQMKTKKMRDEEEDVSAMPLPQINATDEWRKQREAEKIRQAQERAKARVLRKGNHLDALTATSNQHADQDCGRPRSSGSALEEAQGQIEANRRRALERIKLRKLELAEEQARAAAVKQEELTAQQPNDEMVKKTEAFRHRTLQRLQAAKREAQSQDAQSSATEPENPRESKEDAEERERERKRLAKQRRRETAERLKRQQQVAVEQQRREQELFEKGLNDFKTKKREQDRVAKGLPPKRSVADPVVVFEPATAEPSSPESSAKAQLKPSFPSQEQPETASVVADNNSDHNMDDGAAEDLILSAPRTDTLDTATHEASNDSVSSRPRPKKVPSWKQPPVPVLPAECYAQKALVSPSESYVERFQLRTGRTSPIPTPHTAFTPPQARKLRHGHAVPTTNQREKPNDNASPSQHAASP